MEQRPLKRPKPTMSENILKKDLKTYDLEKTSMENAKKVEAPPFMTAAFHACSGYDKQLDDGLIHSLLWIFQSFNKIIKAYNFAIWTYRARSPSATFELSLAWIRKLSWTCAQCARCKQISREKEKEKYRLFDSRWMQVPGSCEPFRSPRQLSRHLALVLAFAK